MTSVRSLAGLASVLAVSFGLLPRAFAADAPPPPAPQTAVPDQPPPPAQDRTSVVSGMRVSVRVDLAGRPILQINVSRRFRTSAALSYRSQRPSNDHYLTTQ